MGKLKIPNPLDPGKLGEWARAAVITAAGLPDNGKGKHRKAVREVAAQVDKFLHFGPGPIGLIAEAIDGPIVRMFVGAIVEFAYRALVREGVIEGPT